jgi:hypothetical protein
LPTAPSASPSDTAPPPLPVHDLAADVQSRVAQAHAELGAKAPVDVVADAFVLADAHPGPVYGASVSLARDALAAYFNGRFSRHPSHAVSVWISTDADSYQAFCRKRRGRECPKKDLGVYDRLTREIFVNAGNGMTTLTHELVHPIVQSDFPGAPEWINEGLGALFEMPVLPRPGEIHGRTNWRLDSLRDALASKAERDRVRIEALFAMSDDAFRKAEEEDLHYAMARYFCQWLDERGQLWGFYQTWRDGFARDPTGETAFAQVVGMTPAQATAPWVEWVREL